ncbi:hypothetical protein CTAM01_11670 [Colletotrichum tamarilloi]|uniref:Heterokaryon incompatibility domain-containing protein n=1 Tax=Colletotrichum tamarilloi TaxID=1209934 RepID=A0ABQ9QX07_9PEZI|nr:uncharacterized protein CTAM01_11670 [Colletotrichum tamarilloi]KAK1487824.1 hypothetical protein CTAM01_11670 [Colletotrichum tamarilloi]
MQRTLKHVLPTDLGPQSPSPTPTQMKLVHCTTRKISNHSFPLRVDYAILSHVYSTPGHDEWDAYDSASLPDNISRKAVIDNACLLARQNGLDYIWIDSLCIDKNSFDEVSHAINSLSEYFQNARICFVYLFDLPCCPPYECAKTWKKSLFWNRSWSLQELLFPKRIYFYDCNWHLRGDTSSLAFQSFLERVTGIEDIPRDTSRPIHSFSVARKMSWAAGKKDTRGEDSSYALLGIFGVTLPIIYGEGKQLAFRNLQGAILDKTGDMSLFAWTSFDGSIPRGIFANSADEFSWFGRTKFAGVPFKNARTFTISRSRDGVVVEGNCIVESEDTIFLDLGNGARLRSYDYLLAQRCGILIRRGVSGIYHRVQPSAIQTASATEHAKAMRITIDAGDFTNGSVKATRFNHLRNSKTRTRSISNKNTVLSIDGIPIQDDPSSTGSPLQQRAPVDDSEKNCAGSMREEKSPTIEHQRNQSEEAGQTSVKQECILDAIPTGLDPDTFVEPSSARAVTPESLDDNTAGSSTKAATATSAKQSFASYRALADDNILVKSLARKAHKSFKTYQHIVSHDTGREKRRSKTNTLPITSGRRGSRKSQRRDIRARSTEFACPLFVDSPWEHLQCLRVDALITMSDVKDHIWTAHRIPYNCPVCAHTFCNASLRDKHIISRGCESSGEAIFGGVTEDQDYLIARTQQLPGRKKQWFAVWKILNSSTTQQPPKSPFLSDTMGSEVAYFRNFYQSYKLRGKKTIGVGSESLIRLDEAVLREVINILVDEMLKSPARLRLLQS